MYCCMNVLVTTTHENDDEHDVFNIVIVNVYDIVPRHRGKYLLLYLHPFQGRADCTSLSSIKVSST
jgi:hypothetical protein